MSLKIFHITDIHFSITKENHLLNKQEALFRSIVSELRDSDHVLFCITGDTVNFGIEDEYTDFALPFFDELRNYIKTNLPDLVCEFIFIPGNHDCDFSNSEIIQLRNEMLRLPKQNRDMINNTSFIKSVKTQKSFEDFKSLFHSDWINCRLVQNNELFDKVVLEINNKKIVFNLFNTSWISTLKEKPGEMLFPVEYVRELALSSFGDINISLLHHPSHWIEHNNKREFEGLIQEVSDIVLSGHEHITSSTTLTDWNRREVHFVEGTALQELGNPQISGYNILNLNLEDMTFCVRNITWNNTFYGENGQEEVWKSIRLQSSAKSMDPEQLFLNEEFNVFLNDIGIPIYHPRVHHLTLKDIYVYPNVEEVIYKEDTEIINSPKEIPEILNSDKESHLLFTGDKDSGKTALAKILFQYFYNEKYFPLFVNGEKITSSSKNINVLIKKNYEKVYVDGKLELYLQLPKDERILVIDDWHKCILNGHAKSRFLAEANKYFKQVIFFSEVNNTVSTTIDLLAENKNEIQVRHFEMMDFGHVKREDFIEKWVSLGQIDTIETNHLIKEIVKIKRILKPILMQSFVPKYPLYLLVIIKAIESGTPHNLDKSSNGYYFEILIKDSLACIEVDNNETDKIYQYLTDLAYEILLNPNQALTSEEWRSFHKKHLSYYDMNEDQLVYKDLQNKFCNEKVIRYSTSGYEFYYPYVYYFFIAQFLARNINKNEVKEKIKELCNNLHITENANILMFLTHLSKDDFIINEVLNSAKKIFKGVSPLKLEDDIDIINSLCDKVSPLIIEDVNVREHRKIVNEKLDEFERSTSDESGKSREQIAAGNEEDAEVSNVIEKLDLTNKGFKMLDIIGQILKNYYGSMSGEDKKVLCEEHFQLGLRMNHYFIEDLKNENENLVKYIASVIIEKGLDHNTERAEKLAKRILYFMGGFITYNSILKIGTSIGTTDLERTFERVKERLPFNSVELIYLFIKIEYYETFPYTEVSRYYRENINNKIVKQIIQTMVKRHLYMYETNRTEKQRLCDLVGLSIDNKSKLETKRS